MRVIRSLKQMSEVSRKTRSQGKQIGLAPTMGALHQGHLSLIRQARKENDVVVASIFVNPAQFAPQEDFHRYPRPIQKDLNLCRQEKVDFVFFPAPKAMYPKFFKTYVELEDLGSVLCGRKRPGHFRGVATIVAKLFNIVQPDVAYFGQKDAQQAVIIKRISEDLNFPVKIKVLPTVRESHGLALSSRNVYLSAQEKDDAMVLAQSLKLAKKMYSCGIKDSAKIIRAMKRLIGKKTGAKIDYIACVDNLGLKPVKKIRRGTLVALAVRFGKKRLIDNTCLN